MRYQSNVLKRSKYELWIILFLTITFVIDLVSTFYPNGLEDVYFLAYRISGIIAFTLIVINEYVKYQQTHRKLLLFTTTIFVAILLGLIVSTIQTLL